MANGSPAEVRTLLTVIFGRVPTDFIEAGRFFAARQLHSLGEEAVAEALKRVTAEIQQLGPND